MPVDHERFMREALAEAEASGAEGNLAVGSVITRDGSIVARGHNLTTSTHDPTAHAETVAIRNAGAVLRSEDLSGCTLYTTFQPCPMCCGALMMSRIATVVLGARLDPSVAPWGSYTMEKLFEMAGWEQKIEVVTGVLVQECANARQEWQTKNDR